MANYYLDDKVLDVNNLSKDARSDENLFKELLSGVKSKDNIIRSNSFRTLIIMSEEYTEFLYPHWDYFVDMLRSSNN
jgi:hypothetical protein